MDRFDFDYPPEILMSRHDFDYPFIKNGSLISQRLPLVRKIYQKGAANFTVSKGKTIEIQGYLESSKLKCNFSNCIEKWKSEFGIDLSGGFNVYKLFLETSRIPTEVLVISTLGSSEVSTGLPLDMTLLKMEDRKFTRIFYLSDFRPTMLKCPAIDLDFPLLDRERLIKSIQEVSSLSTKDADMHAGDALISNYIGSDFLDDIADGIGSSYANSKMMKLDLMNLQDALDDKRIGMPLSHFGIINRIDGNISDINTLRKQALKKLMHVSWNLPSGNSADNFRLSEFKYSVKGGLNIWNVRDLQNNLDFKQSLIIRSLMPKPITHELFNKVMIEAVGEISKWVDRSDKNMIYNIVETGNNLEEQIGRIASYYSSFENDEKNILPLVKMTVAHNIGDILEVIAAEESYRKFKSESVLERERSIDPKVRTAFYSSDGTRDDIIKKFMEFLPWTEKYATEYFDNLIKSGMIFTRDNVHYVWMTLSRVKFR